MSEMSEGDHIKWHRGEGGDYPRPCRCIVQKDHVCPGCQAHCIGYDRWTDPAYQAPTGEDLLRMELWDVRGLGSKLIPEVVYWVLQSKWLAEREAEVATRVREETLQGIREWLEERDG